MKFKRNRKRRYLRPTRMKLRKTNKYHETCNPEKNNGTYIGTNKKKEIISNKKILLIIITFSTVSVLKGGRDINSQSQSDFTKSCPARTWSDQES